MAATRVDLQTPDLGLTAGPVDRVQMVGPVAVITGWMVYYLLGSSPARTQEAQGNTTELIIPLLLTLTNQLILGHKGTRVCTRILQMLRDSLGIHMLINDGMVLEEVNSVLEANK